MFGDSAMIRHKLMKVVRDPGILLRKVTSPLIEHKKSSLDLERERERSIRFLREHFGVDAAVLHDEYWASPFARWYGRRYEELQGLVEDKETSSRFDLVTLYMLVRALEPKVVVETGVNYGGSSAHILAAMRENGFGKLYSIDLPKARALPALRQDFLVPPELQGDWHLILGDSRDELPKLLHSLGQIDHFHHDSLHTAQHMSWEYETAFGHIRPGGVLSSHDVIVPLSLQNVFEAFCRRRGLTYGVFRNVGIALC